MITANLISSSRVNEAFRAAGKLSVSERLVLAKLLLDSLVEDEMMDQMDWVQMGLSTFEQDWDNADDAIYDNWRDVYGVSTG